MGVAMVRAMKKAREISKEMQLMIDASTALDGACRKCRAPRPIPLQGTDENGCNWTPSPYSGPPECADVIAAIVRSTMERFNLRP